MMGDDAERLLVLTALFVLAAMSSAALNYGTVKVWPNRMALTHWIINVGTVPTLLISYGLFAYLIYVPADCTLQNGFAYLCVDPEVEKSIMAFRFILLFPLSYVCVAIPTTMWFLTRWKTQ